jgi:beta-galactosidase
MGERASTRKASSEGFLSRVVVFGALTLVACGSTGGNPGTGGPPGTDGMDAAATSSSGSMSSGGSGGSSGSTSSGGSTGSGSSGSAGSGGSGGSNGSSGSGGSGGSGGSTDSGAPTANQVRTVMPFDNGWLFFLGDATGADQAAFADSAWRSLNVPHDWSIEGPFDQNATTLGNGGYLPAGVGWYRKHFTLPANLSGRRIFVEFDGVMANSDVYINGTHLSNRPYGYVSFRYEITAQATFGATANVIAVRVDDSAQPASRWYAGAGIYRHVRLIGADPVHVGQWATTVTTPTVSATAATVHVQTTVVNQGTTSQSVTVQAVVSDPAGTKLAPVTSAAQSVAAGGSADFAVDVPVANPKLWSTTSPNMYELVTNVAAGGTTLDDDVTAFGIRTIQFDPTAGFSLNGTNMKLKGMAIHPDVSGLGTAVPMRAWQRRLAQMKGIGANALRTAHNPFAPEVLDLCDRMGILVLDEFFDAWTQHKLAADYGGATFNTWGTMDMSDAIKRDRNHPSVVLYSIGNEIRDSLASRMTTATNLVGISHMLDPTRPVTQALFRPMTSGDYPGAMLNILDVFGANYRITEVTAAIALTPPHAGVVTEDVSTSTADWMTVTTTPALTGDFIWTAFDYLGEAAGLWPTIGSSTGVMDRVGTLKPIAYSFQGIWGTATTAPATGTAATQIALTADHTSLLTDPNDVSYIKATIADANGHVVTSSSNPVTFSLTGPGTIVAVDSGSVTSESFRGTQRNAFQGVCFAILQATGPGTITVTASTPGLTGASVTVQSSAGTFVPCSGTCD